MKFIETLDLEDAPRPCVLISDGELSHYAETDDIEAAIEAYSETYEFNDAGEVECVAELYMPGDEEGCPTETRQFVIEGEGPQKHNGIMCCG